MRQVLKDSAHRHTVWERNLQAMRSVVGLCVAWLSGRCGVRRLRVCGVCVHCDPNVCAPQGCTYADGWVWDTRCMGSSAPQCERLGKPRRRAHSRSILQPQRAVADVRWLATRSASACLMSTAGGGLDDYLRSNGDPGRMAARPWRTDRALGLQACTNPLRPTIGAHPWTRAGASVTVPMRGTLCVAARSMQHALNDGPCNDCHQWRGAVR